MIKKLQKQKLEAMKNKDNIAKSILSVLHADALNLAKQETRDVTEADVVKAAKSLIKKNEQTIQLICNKPVSASVDVLIKENEILERFLPKQMTELEIKFEVNSLLGQRNPEELVKKNQGKYMKELKDKFQDSINMGLAAKYVSMGLRG